MFAAIPKTVRGWPYVPVRSVVLLEGVTDTNHYGAKFPIPQSVIQQSPWKFGLHLYLTSLHCRYLIVFHMPPFFHALHSLEQGTSLPQSSVYVLKCFTM
jgi:hypothetical protein